MLSQNRHFFFRRRRDKQGGKVAFCSIRPQLPRFDQVFSSSPSFYSHLNVPTESVKTSCFPPCFRQCKLLYLLRNPAKYDAVSFPPLALKGHRVPPLNRKTQTEEVVDGGGRRHVHRTRLLRPGRSKRLSLSSPLVSLFYFSRKLKADAVGASTVGEQCRGIVFCLRFLHRHRL